MIVGIFTKTETGTFEGEIETLIFSATLKIVPVEKSTDRAPSYRVYSAHNDVEIGAGWDEKSQKGEPYISIKIDDPSFAYPMWSALTKLEDGYALRWSRPRPKTDPEAAGDEVTL